MTGRIINGNLGVLADHKSRTSMQCQPSSSKALDYCQTLIRVAITLTPLQRPGLPYFEHSEYFRSPVNRNDVVELKRAQLRTQMNKRD